MVGNSYRRHSGSSFKSAKDNNYNMTLVVIGL